MWLAVIVLRRSIEMKIKGRKLVRKENARWKREMKEKKSGQKAKDK